MTNRPRVCPRSRSLRGLFHRPQPVGCGRKWSRALHAHELAGVADHAAPPVDSNDTWHRDAFVRRGPPECEPGGTTRARRDLFVSRGPPCSLAHRLTSSPARGPPAGHSTLFELNAQQGGDAHEQLFFGKESVDRLQDGDAGSQDGLVPGPVRPAVVPRNPSHLPALHSTQGRVRTAHVPASVTPS